jgi:hypothetical protein
MKYAEGSGLAPLVFNLGVEFILVGLIIVLKGKAEYVSSQVLAHAEGIAFISRSLPDVTKMDNEFAVEAKELCLEISTKKTKSKVR